MSEALGLDDDKPLQDLAMIQFAQNCFPVSIGPRLNEKVFPAGGPEKYLSTTYDDQAFVLGCTERALSTA